MHTSLHLYLQKKTAASFSAFFPRSNKTNRNLLWSRHPNHKLSSSIKELLNTFFTFISNDTSVKTLKSKTIQRRSGVGSHEKFIANKRG